jgi:hypothetical protein
MSIADVLTPNSLVSGSYLATWSTLAGYTSPPSSVVLNWQRLGTVVHCAFIAVGVGSSGIGPDTATITLPVPRALAFSGAPAECSGAGAVYSVAAGGGAFFTPTTGGFTATVNSQTGGPGIVNISGFFTYLL